ncbi:hypothetical protein Adt_42094 [Abeliophyllum distichum]|uniref:Retrotransposon gag domain-containing protein n=1 Tax=Abeliophyllum distichum TaxID=126358 RepID=A0ABD1PQP7_9LAMI
MTISDCVGALEQQVESNHAELHMGLDALRTEFQQMHFDMMGKFDLILRTWESQERERKEKGPSQTKSAKPSSNSVLPQNSAGGIQDGRGEREGSWGPDRRMDMPVFTGEDPDGWIFRAERYFAINRMTEELKLEAVVVCFEGESLAWYQWEEKRRPIRNWEELKARLLRRFRPSQEGFPYAQFLTLRQVTTVKEYRR